MNRFFGMMPSSEIKVSKQYMDSHKLRIRIDAGDNGWTITYADGSTEYRDESVGTETNLTNAYEIAVSRLGELKEFSNNIVLEEA